MRPLRIVTASGSLGERNSQREANCLSPLHLSVDRQLRRLPGGLGYYRKCHFHLGPAWSREARGQEGKFMGSRVPNNTEKVECKRLSHANEFCPAGGLFKVLSRRRCKCCYFKCKGKRVLAEMGFATGQACLWDF